MRMPEPEEDKVTATGGGMRASGLLKLGAVRRSLSLEERSVSTTVRFNRKFSRSMLLCVCAFFDRATRLSRLRLRAASNRAQETSELSTCLCARPHCACVCLVANIFVLHVKTTKSVLLANSTVKKAMLLYQWHYRQSLSKLLC